MYDVERATNTQKTIKNFQFGLEENFKTTNATAEIAMLEFEWRNVKSDVKTETKILDTLLVLQ